jgi:hypothetical protein
MTSFAKKAFEKPTLLRKCYLAEEKTVKAARGRCR